MKQFLPLLSSAFLLVGCASETKQASNEEISAPEEVADTDQTESSHPTLGDTLREIEGFYASYDQTLEEPSSLSSETDFTYAAENSHNILRVGNVLNADTELGRVNVLSSVTPETVWATLTRHIPADYELVYGRAWHIEEEASRPSTSNSGGRFVHYFSNYAEEPPYSYIKADGQFSFISNGEEKYSMSFTLSKEEGQVVGELLSLKEEVDQRDEEGALADNQLFIVTSEEDIFKTVSGGFTGEATPMIQWETLSDQQKMLFSDFIDPCSDPTSREYTLQGHENYSTYLSEEVQEIPRKSDHFVMALQEEKEQFENMGCGF